MSSTAVVQLSDEEKQCGEYGKSLDSVPEDDEPSMKPSAGRVPITVRQTVTTTREVVAEYPSSSQDGPSNSPPSSPSTMPAMPDSSRPFQIDKPAKCKKVMGMGLLGHSLYVVSVGGFVMKYTLSYGDDDSSTSNITLNGPVKIPIDGMVWPRGLAVCQRHRTLYITDWSKVFGGSVWIVRTAGEQSSLSKVEFSIQPFGISVLETADTVDVFVTCCTPSFGLVSNQQILHYRDDGSVLSRLETNLALPAEFEIPRHAVHVVPSTSGCPMFTVCHGWTRMFKHQVSIVKMLPSTDRLVVEASYGDKR